MPASKHSGSDQDSSRYSITLLLISAILVLITLVYDTGSAAAEGQSGGAVMTSPVPKARPLAPFTSPIPVRRPSNIQDRLEKNAALIKLLANQ